MPRSRYDRQAAIVPRARIEECKATVVGVGAIGRNVAIQLASIGAPDLQLIDFDIVEETNVVTQGYHQEDIGKSKVDTTAEMCARINPNINITKRNARFSRYGEHGNAIFCCVDDMDIRKMIWETVSEKADFFIDGRMSAEVLRVLAADTPENKRYYPTTLFPQANAYAGACTARSTAFCANIAAGFLVSSFSKWLRDIPLEPDFTLNLLATEITFPKDELKTI